MQSNRPDAPILLACAAVFGAMAVAAGAYAAHGASGDAAAWIETGSRYQLVHAALLVALAWTGAGPLLRYARWLLLLGSGLFAGSLYGLAGTGVGSFAAIAPLGGLCLILGWLTLAMAAMVAIRLRKAVEEPHNGAS